MKDFINKIHFEYILLFIVTVSAALLLYFENIYCLLPILLPAALAIWKINAVKGSIIFAAVLLLLCFNLPIKKDDADSLKNQLAAHPVYAKIRFEITDPLCCSIKRIKNGAVTEVVIHNAADLTGREYQGSGKFLIYSDKTLPPDAAYGDIFEVNGTLRFGDSNTAWDTDNSLADGDFRFGDFNKYMKLRNIAGIISPDRDSTVQKVAQNNSWARKFILFRDRTLEYMTRGLSDDNANLTGALFFGLKGALDKNSKQQFIKSGTVHLFSVSGFHIALLFGIILNGIYFLPLKRKYITSALLTLPFLLSTGANIPAIRAFLMILIFALLKEKYFYIPPLRILSACCALFVMFNVNYLADAGFLYSFSITGILLLLSENIPVWNRTWHIESNLKAVNRKNPVKYKNFTLHSKKFVFALCGTVAAFACSSIITLVFFGYLYLSAVWINFFILFYCSYLVCVMLLQTIFNIIAPAGLYFSIIFDKSLDLMKAVIEFGAEYPCQINSVQIPWWWAFLFYPALIIIITSRDKKLFTAGVVFLSAFFPCSVMYKKVLKNELLMIHDPSSSQTAFVLALPRSDYAWAYNIQNGESMELARKFLASKGIYHLNMWVQYGSAKNKISALEKTSGNLKIYDFIHFARSELADDIKLPSDMFYTHIAQISPEFDFKKGISRFFRKKNQLGFEYFNPEAIIPICVVSDNETQRVSVRKNGIEHTKQWMNSNLLEYSVYEL